MRTADLSPIQYVLSETQEGYFGTIGIEKE